MQLVLNNKSGQATQRVARILSRVEVGRRIPTVAALTEECETARGNIQLALANLKKLKAITLEAHGQNGTILTAIDYGMLARICGVQNLVGSMPLPYTRRYEGLATALFTLLNHGDMSTLIAFMRGSEARVRGLLEGRENYCVMSRLAYLDYLKRGVPLMEALDCGSESYVGRHVLLLRPDFDGRWENCRVGIDASSADQSLLTHAYFAGRQVQFVPVQYMQILPMLQKGELDVGIWNEDDLDGKNGAVRTQEFTLKGEPERNDNRAVIVVKKDDTLVRHLLKDSLKLDEVLEIQHQVMRGERTACY